VVAAAASAGAGLIHAAAAGSHGDASSLVWLFALCAAAQLGWAALVVAAPSRTVLVLGAGLNATAVVVWFLTRTVGFPLVDALAEVEPVGTQDLVCGLLGALAVAASVLALAQPISRRTMPASWSAMVVVGTVALVVPAMAAGHAGGHTHLASEHVHADGEAHEHSDGSGGHDHDVATASSDSHSHDDADSSEHSDADGHHGADVTHDESGSHTDATHQNENHSHGGTQLIGTVPHGHSQDPTDPAHQHPTGPTSPTDPPHEHPQGPTGPPHEHPTGPTSPTDPPHEHPQTPTGPIVSLDDPRLTAAQRDAGNRLLYSTLAGMAPFPNVTAVEAAGYRSIGDAGTGFEHFVNWTYFNDGIEMDPNRIESIVIKIGPNGEKVVASAMFILNLGKGLGDVPEIAGSLTSWHNHTNLCWVPNGEGGMRLSGVTDANGNCARGQNIVTPPMIHVWLTPQPCGPFSGIEGTHGSSCTHEH
jgi:hypothetical protein